MDLKLFEQLSAAVDQGRLVKSTMEMVALKSENPFLESPRPGYREKEMADYLAGRLAELGLEVESRPVVPDRPNVFGCLKGRGTGPTLMLAGHMDTARTDGYAEAYSVREAGGRIYGRGSCDMKAGLAAYLEVVRVLREARAPLRGHLIVAGVMDEEFGMLGSQDVGRNGPRADQGIIAEPTELTVCPANKGRVSTFIRTFGRAAHSSVPEQGENAIVRMARVIQAFADYPQELLARPPHPLCGQGRFNPGVIKGGVQVNMVPDRCELEVDRRTLPGETQESVYAELRARLDPLAGEDPGFRYELTKPSWLIPANDVPLAQPVVRALLQAYERVLGRPTQATAFPAGSDAPHLGCPTVVCGPGSIAQAHTTNEFVAVPEIVAATRMYLHVSMELLT